MRRCAAVLLVLVLILPSFLFAADDSTLVGYSPRSSQTERDWEAKLRAIPDPANLREDMRRLSAHPHHVGSAYDKDNAEWILARFKEWGLDAHIETFNVLFPTPKVRVLETLDVEARLRLLIDWTRGILADASLKERIRSEVNVFVDANVFDFVELTTVY